MRTLIVFDSFTLPENIREKFFSAQDRVFIFPLTSKSNMNDFICKKIQNIGCKVESIPSAKLINSSAEQIRDMYIKFVAGLPDSLIYRRKNLREYFSIDNFVTLWWFSAIAEKNTFKTDSFNRLVQLDAIAEVIRSEKVENIIFSSKSRKLANALFEYAQENGLFFKRLKTSLPKNIKSRFRDFQKFFYLKHIFHLGYLFFLNLMRTFKIKKGLINLTRPEVNDNALMVITPYPNFDKELAEQGIFKNKFYSYLQEGLNARGQGLLWVAMYVQNDILSLEESINYACKFIKSGYRLLFLEEFNSFFQQLKALLKVFSKGLDFLRIKKLLRSKHTFGTYNFYSIFRDDWYSSFMGSVGFMGILYYYNFRNLFREFNLNKCLYSCEMQAWEKALIGARNSLGKQLFLNAYQAGTVSRMLLNYFNDPGETNDSRAFAIPQPGRIICNSSLTYGYMKECGWPESMLYIAEAFRYNHVRNSLLNGWPQKSNVVLLAFSISPEESSAILNIACQSLFGLKDAAVWLKPHPFLEIEKVFRLSGITKDDLPFEIKNEPIEKLLTQAKVVIAGESGVSIEALALGCSVVIVNIPEWINMSPLGGRETKMVRKVNSAQELRSSVLDIINNVSETKSNSEEVRGIINQYFYFNLKSDIPENLLELLLSEKY